MAFDGGGSWSFDNDFVRNVVIFGVNDSSSSHADNRQNTFLVLGEGPTDDINSSVGTTEKKSSTNFGRGKTKFFLSLHYNGGNSYLFDNGKKIYKFKADNKNINFPTQFCLESISNEFGAVKSKEVSYKRNMWDFFHYITILTISLTC